MLLDLDALQISALTGLNRNTVKRYLKLIRQRIADYCDSMSPFLGEIELDESYFGAHRVRGKSVVVELTIKNIVFGFTKTWR